MPATPEALFERLDALGITTVTHYHEPVHTMAQNQALRGNLPGGHAKNLYLRDQKKQNWLVVVREDREVDLKALAEALDAGRFSFGRPERLQEVLGVEPGSVTPFALINDSERKVKVVLDEALLQSNPLNFHPLVNHATTAIAPHELVHFLQHLGYEPQHLGYEPQLIRF